MVIPGKQASTLPETSDFHLIEDQKWWENSATMPTCDSCQKTFSDRRHFYCDSCRCIQANCEGLRSGGPKCLTHQGLCMTPNCKQTISPGQRYCSACLIQRSAKASAQLAPEVKPTDNIGRKAAVYATVMSNTLTDREHIAAVIADVNSIAATKQFNKLLNELVGWKNLKSWARWVGRSAEPAILKRDRMSSIVTVMENELNAASVRRAYFAERFLEEVNLICNAEIEKTDISYMVGMAFTVFGPLLAPLSAAAQAAASATATGANAVARGMATKAAISLGQTLTQVGVTAGLNYAEVGSSVSAGMSKTNATSATGVASASYETWDNIQTRSRSNAVIARPVPEPDQATDKEREHYSVNPLQYAVCLFQYLSEKSPLTDYETRVVKEFGGADKVQFLYETLEDGAAYP